jgi:hypothetical protein
MGSPGLSDATMGRPHAAETSRLEDTVARIDTIDSFTQAMRPVHGGGTRVHAAVCPYFLASALLNV